MTPLQTEWAPRALLDLKRLDRVIARRIVEAVERLAGSGEGDVRRMVDSSPPEYRLRVGDFRVRFGRDDERGSLVVLRVLNRREAYR